MALFDESATFPSISAPKVLFPAHKVPGTKIWPDFFMVRES